MRCLKTRIPFTYPLGYEFDTLHQSQSTHLTFPLRWDRYTDEKKKTWLNKTSPGLEKKGWFSGYSGTNKRWLARWVNDVPVCIQEIEFTLEYEISVFLNEESVVLKEQFNAWVNAPSFLDIPTLVQHNGPAKHVPET